MAAASGNAKAVEWLIDYCGKIPMTASFYAAKAGHFELAKKLYTMPEHGLEKAAVMHENIEFLEWLISVGFAISLDLCGLEAIKHGKQQVLKWVRNRGWVLDSLASVIAAKTGKIEMLQWVKDNGGPWCVKAMNVAALQGDLELVKWLRANGCPWNEHTSRKVAYDGKFEIFKWLIENSCPYAIQMDQNSGIMQISAAKLVGYRKFKTLAYLKDFGINLNAECYKRCKNSNDLETLYQIGCPLSATSWTDAIGTSNLNTLEWLKSKNCPWNTTVAYLSLCLGRSIEVLEWFQKNGYETTVAVTNTIVVENKLEDLKRLVKSGWPCDTSTTKAAANQARGDHFKWLVKYGCPVDLEECERITTSIVIKSFIKKRRVQNEIIKPST